MGARKKQYDQMCKVLASGMNLHLSENELIRSIFSLGAPLPSLSEVSSNRPSKHERHHANQIAFKWRTQTRGKNRDKRSAVVWNSQIKVTFLFYFHEKKKNPYFSG